jgi:hypothetical protein
MLLVLALVLCDCSYFIMINTMAEIHSMTSAFHRHGLLTRPFLPFQN